MDNNELKLDQMRNVAIDAAIAAGRAIMEFYDSGTDVEWKSDGSPVTAADKAAEAIIHQHIAAHYPDHTFIGEETGTHTGTGPVSWFVDPLDGTKSFVSRTAFFSVQIAAAFGEDLAVGVSHAPVSGELASAVVDGIARIDNRPIQVSQQTEIAGSRISTGNIQTLAASARWPALGEILASAARTRGYGDYVHYHLLARGELDAVIESDVNILDIAALTVIVRAAGGIITDLDGKPIGPETRSIIAAPPQLHRALLDRLNA